MDEMKIEEQLAIRLFAEGMGVEEVSDIIKISVPNAIALKVNYEDEIEDLIKLYKSL